MFGLVVSRFVAWIGHFFSTTTLMKEFTLIGIVALFILVHKLIVVNIDENQDEAPGVTEMLWLLMLALGAIIILFIYPLMDPSDEIHAYTWRDMNGQLMMIYLALSITNKRAVLLTNMLLPGLVIVYLSLAGGRGFQWYYLAFWFLIAMATLWTKEVTIGLRRGGLRRWTAEIAFAASWWGMLVLANNLTIEHFLVLIGEFVFSMFIVYRGCRALRYVWLKSKPRFEMGEVE
jgi:hypothetical protein